VRGLVGCGCMDLPQCISSCLSEKIVIGVYVGMCAYVGMCVYVCMWVCVFGYLGVCGYVCVCRFVCGGVWSCVKKRVCACARVGCGCVDSL